MCQCQDSYEPNLSPEQSVPDQWRAGDKWGFAATAMCAEACDLVNTVVKNEEESAPHSLIAYVKYLTHLLGPSHGCIGEREDLNALPHLVRSARSLDARHESCPIEQINRPLSSSNNPASLTSRLGATIDVEQNHVRFLGDLILNLWDCGGQDAFMDSYLSTQRSTIFQHVGVLIYVFEVSTHDAAKDAAYYRDCLDALQKYSPEAGVFLLVHKMDLVTGDRTALLERRTRELQAESGAVRITVFGTSIHDESLYKVRLPPMFLFSPSSQPPSTFSLRVSGLTSAGVVENRPHDHPERGRSNETSDDVCASLQRHRSHPVRAHNVPRHRHLLPSGRSRASG